MMEKLQWLTLEYRRKNRRLTTMFKIVHGLVAVPTTSLISADSRTRCNHQYKFKCILASTTAYRNSFYPEHSPSGTTLTKNLPKRLPSTASRVACISPPSPFIGSLSTMFQIQIGANISIRGCCMSWTPNTKSHDGDRWPLITISISGLDMLPSPYSHSAPICQISAQSGNAQFNYSQSSTWLDTRPTFSGTPISALFSLKVERSEPYQIGANIGEL